MASTDSRVAVSSAEPAWRTAGLRYYAYRFFLRNRFGSRVQKVSLDAGFTCPNVDGTVAIGGCNFCDNRSFSPSRRVRRQAIAAQLADGMFRLKTRYKNCRKFMAYFQPATNTYAPVEELRPLYEEAISHPEVVGLAIGTRPDCLPNDVLDLIQELATRTYVSLELGLQTMHDRSLTWMNRGHDYASFVDAVTRARGRGIELCAHIMLGLPTETHEDMLATAREVARLKLDAVKIHNLYIVKRTALAEPYERGELKLLERDEYIRAVVDFLELMPPETIIERVSGEAPPQYFLGPSWCLDKPALKAAIEAEFERRDTWQGKKYVESSSNIAPVES